MATTDVVLEIPRSKKQVKTKVLFDQGLQRSCITQRIKNMLGLTATSIYTFNCKNSENSKLEKLSMYLKRLFNFTFFIKALYKPFVCLPVKNQPYKFVKDNFESFKDLELAGTGPSKDIKFLIGSEFY